MAKVIKFNEEARAKIKAGIDQVADAVKITIGPRGRNVILDKGFGSPVITNDGVSIAKEIEVEDKFSVNPEVETYGGRSLGATTCPGILVDSFALTL